MKKLLIVFLLLIGIIGYGQVRTYRQSMTVNSYADLSTINAQAGDKAYCSDTKAEYLFNGTAWIAGINGNLTPPTVVAGTGAGAGAQIALAGNNRNGYISLTQGTGGLAGGQIMVLTLANNFSYPTKATISFAAGNAAFAGIVANLYCTSTGNTITLMLNGVALTAGTVYAGYYQISGY